LIFSLSLSIIAILYVPQQQKAMAQNTTTPSPSPSQATNITAEDFLTYENTTYEIRIQYPAVWQKGESNQTSQDDVINTIVAFRAPKDRISDTIAENIIIGVENLPPEENISLAAYSTLQIADLTQFSTDFDLEQSTPIVLADSPAQKIVFSETVQQIPIKTMQVWTIKDNEAYIITFAGEAAKYSDYLPTIQKMIDSFEFINSTRGSNNSTAQSSTSTNQ
jgi:eukaryotic-like serine/threonine-protein kinase